ncbi:outer membrane beta-barrel protein [bacterium]|nr:outer membrane beta-barrel protein [bacterium]
MRRNYWIPLLLIAMLAGSAFSDDMTDKFGLEISGGWYHPEFSQLNGGINYGGSFSYHFLPWLYAELRASVFKREILDFDVQRRTTTKYKIIERGQVYMAGSETLDEHFNFDNIKARIAPIDINIGFSFLNDSKVNPYISLGGTFFDAKIDELPDPNITAFGFNAGLGTEIFLASLFEDRANLAIVIDGRYHWGEASFGLDYTKKSCNRYFMSSTMRMDVDEYVNDKLKDLDDEIDLGGFSGSLGLKLYF